MAQTANLMAMFSVSVDGYLLHMYFINLKKIFMLDSDKAKHRKG